MLDVTAKVVFSELPDRFPASSGFRRGPFSGLARVPTWLGEWSQRVRAVSFGRRCRNVWSVLLFRKAGQYQVGLRSNPRLNPDFCKIRWI